MTTISTNIDIDGNPKLVKGHKILAKYADASEHDIITTDETNKELYLGGVDISTGIKSLERPVVVLPNEEYRFIAFDDELGQPVFKYVSAPTQDQGKLGDIAISSDAIREKVVILGTAFTPIFFPTDTIGPASPINSIWSYIGVVNPTDHGVDATTAEKMTVTKMWTDGANYIFAFYDTRNSPVQVTSYLGNTDNLAQIMANFDWNGYERTNVPAPDAIQIPTRWGSVVSSAQFRLQVWQETPLEGEGWEIIFQGGGGGSGGDVTKAYVDQQDQQLKSQITGLSTSVGKNASDIVDIKAQIAQLSQKNAEKFTYSTTQTGAGYFSGNTITVASAIAYVMQIRIKYTNGNSAILWEGDDYNKTGTNQIQFNNSVVLAEGDAVGIEYISGGA